MERITIHTVNAYGPLVFPAKEYRVYCADHLTPARAFEVVQFYLKQHDDLTLFEWKKDEVETRCVPPVHDLWITSIAQIVRMTPERPAAPAQEDL